jgi:hypothetical protein
MLKTTTSTAKSHFALCAAARCCVSPPRYAHPLYTKVYKLWWRVIQPLLAHTHFLGALKRRFCGVRLGACGALHVKIIFHAQHINIFYEPG